MYRYLPIGLLLIANAEAQTLVTGPVVGGVRPDGGRIYVRTSAPTPFLIQLSTGLNFSQAMTIAGETTAESFATDIVDVNGLNPGTLYNYRIVRPDTSVMGSGYSFRTFPVNGAVGHYKVAVGSCNYSGNQGLYESIMAFEPQLFIHLGDWGWPPSTFGNDMMLHPDKQASSFAQRYDMSGMKEMLLPKCAIDYVYDDDYSFNDSEGWTYPRIVTSPLPNGQTFYDLQTIQMDPAIRDSTISAYFRYFPSYAPVDVQSGIHHAFTLGNVEFLMLDLRNSRTARHQQFVYDAGTNSYTYQPSANHTMMGAAQRQWLLSRLSTSTADWKVIGSSVIFNKRFKRFLEFMMGIQTLDPQYITYASNLAYMWPGHPDQDIVLNHISANHLKDILVVSGDSHSSMVDDGTNAGLPELSASGMSSNDEGYLNHMIDSVIQFVGLPLPIRDSVWNGGGNGVGNTNFSDSYGTLEFFGKDSLRMCAIDEFDQVMGCVTIYHSSTTLGGRAMISKGDEIMELLYPNPARDRVRISFATGHTIGKDDFLVIQDSRGGIVKVWKGQQIQVQGFEVDTRTMAPGTYMVNYTSKYRLESRKLVVVR
jgi:hypothetical protein